MEIYDHSEKNILIFGNFFHRRMFRRSGQPGLRRDNRFPHATRHLPGLPDLPPRSNDILMDSQLMDRRVRRAVEQTLVDQRTLTNARRTSGFLCHLPHRRTTSIRSRFFQHGIRRVWLSVPLLGLSVSILGRYRLQYLHNDSTMREP